MPHVTRRRRCHARLVTDPTDDQGQLPLNPMPVRAFVPFAIGSIAALVTLLVVSVFCVLAGVDGDGFGWGLLVLFTPFTGFFGYIVYRIPRRVRELRRWEQQTGISDEFVADAPLAGLHRRAWRFRWVFVALLVLAAVDVAVRWNDTGWLWKAIAAACCLMFIVALVVGGRQASRDRAAASRVDR